MSTRMVQKIVLFLLLLGCLAGGITVFAQDEASNTSVADGIALYEAGDYEAALPLLQQSAFQNPLDFEAQARYLVSLLRTHRYAPIGYSFEILTQFSPETLQAIRDEAEAALEVDPTDEGAAIIAAATAVEMGSEDVQMTIDRLFTFDPNHPFGYDTQGFMYQYAGDTDAAAEAFQSALEFSGDDPQLAVDFGVSVAYFDSPEHALEILSHAIELDPEFAEAYIARGRVYGQLMDDLDSAVADFDRALELQPDNYQIYIRRANSYQIAGDDVNAYHDYVRALQLFPHNPYFYGLLYSGLGWQGSIQPLVEARDLVEADAVLTIDAPFNGEMTEHRIVRLPIEGEPGTSYTVTVSAADPMTLDPMLVITDGEGVILAINDDIDGAGAQADGAYNAQITGLAEAGETYIAYILHSGAGSEGAFTVTLEAVEGE